MFQTPARHTATLYDVLTSSTTSETTNGWLRDTLDVVTQYFTMTLRTGLCEMTIAISNVLLTLVVLQHSAERLAMG